MFRFVSSAIIQGTFRKCLYSTTLNHHRPSNFQKLILVFTKKYKTKEEIPDLVSVEIINKSHSEARIKIANLLMLLTVLGSIVAIVTGKAAAKRGESIQQRNLDWHKQYAEDYDKKLSEKK